MALTRVAKYPRYYAKRDDEACYQGSGMPSGAKVRQFLAMAAKAPGAPMLVGCSAHSAMQIYVAAAARQCGVKGIVYTAARGERTEATKYALMMGAEVIEVRPGHLSVIRARAKERGIQYGPCVRWDFMGAIKDAAAQTENLPRDARRIVVPTGSGLLLAGIMGGMAERGMSNIPVTAVCVSDLALGDSAKIRKNAALVTTKPLPDLQIERADGPYSQWSAARLPDGSILDPFYAARALPFVRYGDCFWIPGLRPLSAFPAECLQQLGVFDEAKTD